jgi:hypothetical protein
MRCPNAGFLGGCFLKEFGFGADGIAEHTIDECSISATGELHGFVNGSVLRSVKKKQLIKSQPEQIARIVVEMTGPEFADPEIEQDQVAQNAVEKLRGKGTIGCAQFNVSQTLVEDRVRKFPATAPLFQGG